MIEYGIVLCSRFDSSRVYKKPFRMIGSKMLIEHLIDRLLKTGLNIYLAVPTEQLNVYQRYLKKYLKDKKNIYLISGHKSPLNRMKDVARYYKIKNIIRVCHDKIFVDSKIIHYAINKYKELECNYLYSSEFIEGIGFEIINFNLLEEASDKYKDIEHISYAVKNLAYNSYNLPMIRFYRKEFGVKYFSHIKKLRLLIDYEEDIKFMQKLFKGLDESSNLEDVINYIFYLNIKELKINQLPKITVYTCVHNGDRYIKECIESVLRQTIFKTGCIEYIVVDDYSVDKTRDILDQYKDKIKIIYNKNNLGLASSSNIALENATSNYIIRLDADDYFIKNNAIHKLYKCIMDEKYDAIYPNYCHGSKTRIIHGNKSHHIGGAIFNKRAINNIKFTEGLRGYEGLDFFERAKDMLKIGYFTEEPIFWYRQRKKSLSNTNKTLRDKIKKNIKKGVLGRDLNDICSA